VRVLAALSGGVDSSVAAAMLLEDGHEVVGVTMKLWGGEQDSGCCSIGDVEDARRVAQQLGIAHHVFNFTEDFEAHVVAPYVSAHARGPTPNPCIECNRHLKFDRLLVRAEQLGFDAVATGHHARITPEGCLARGADHAKDQSYVLYRLTGALLPRLRFPVGGCTKAEVRRRAAALGLRTAAKPDSQDTCFITASGGRERFLGARIPLHPGRLVAVDGSPVGGVPAMELVTVGQRRGLGGGGGDRRYALAVDVGGRTVTVGGLDELCTRAVPLDDVTWVSGVAPSSTRQLSAQLSAHGPALPAQWSGDTVRFATPQRRPAPGQAVVLYDGDVAVGGGTAR
jgi:tRNA-uridine 2-sulfurtransferase